MTDTQQETVYRATCSCGWSFGSEMTTPGNTISERTTRAQVSQRASAHRIRRRVLRGSDDKHEIEYDTVEPEPDAVGLMEMQGYLEDEDSPFEECPFCDTRKSTDIGHHLWKEHRTEIEWAARRLDHYAE